ncbi:MAG: sugar phosphate nucleotidyltransferase [bacterium]
MKAIIPLAGRGTRLRPHTHTKPKAMVRVAGKPILGHVLDRLANLDLEEIIFITGHLGEQVEDYVGKHYSIRARYIPQVEMLGQAHAIYLARECVDSDLIIAFIDTIFEADLSALSGLEADGLIFVKEVEDPRRFGVVVVEDGFVAKLVEKPSEAISHLVNIGLYYVRNTPLLFDCIGDLMGRGLQRGGEFYLMDAFQIMIDRGARMVVAPAEVWKDCGKPETLLDTNRYLLDRGERREIPTDNSVIIPPVYIEEGAKISNSIVGPYVSVAEGVEIRSSIVRDSIINRNSVVDSALCSESIIGENTLIKGSYKKINIGDSSEIVLD